MSTSLESNGGSVKCMTEEDFNAANGQRERSGQANEVAQRWADNMTSHYNELAVAGDWRCPELHAVGLGRHTGRAQSG